MPLEKLHVVPVDREPVVLHRVVVTAERDSDEYVDCFKSSAALGLPPRKGSPEERFNLIHGGVSFYRTHRQAEKVALKWGKGEHVAAVQLEPGEGLCLAEWGSRGHVTVWGDPVKLAGMTVDIVAVSEDS